MSLVQLGRALSALVARARRRWGPPAAALLQAAGRASGRGSARLLRWSGRNRNVLLAVARRGAWWSALGLTAWAGRDLLDAFASDEAFASTTWRLALAFVLSTAVMLTADARHMRIGGLLVAFASGAAALLSWFVQGG